MMDLQGLLGSIQMFILLQQDNFFLQEVKPAQFILLSFLQMFQASLDEAWSTQGCP